MADESKSGLEALVKDDVQNGASTDGKMAQDQPGSGEAQRSKGTWITALPAELREGIEAEKYASLGEYVKDLQTRAAGNTVHDNQAFEEGWDRYVEEMRSAGTMLPEEIRNVLKEAKVDAESARKITKAVADYGQAALQESEEAQKQEMAEYIRAHWKDSFNTYNEYVKKGVQTFGKKHPELAQKAAERRSIYSPEFAQLLADYGALLGRSAEQTAPEGSSVPKGDSTNPFGLKHI